MLIVAMGLFGCQPSPPSNAGDTFSASQSSAVGAEGSVAIVAQTPSIEAAAEAPASDSGATPDSVLEAIDALRGLSFEAFLTDSYYALLLRSPEQVTWATGAVPIGTRHSKLDDLSQAYAQETYMLQRAVLELLRQYDRDALTPDERLSYDIYEWHLDDVVRGHRFADYSYPITHCRIGHHYSLLGLLLEAHPMGTRQDAEDYVDRLGQVDRQVEELLAAMQRREDAGVLLPRFIVENTIELLTDYLGTPSRDPSDVDVVALSVYTSFSDRLDDIEDLDAAERDALRGRALAELRSSFVPSYLEQLAYLDHLVTVATDDAGAWKHPDGEAYYAYRVRSLTTTDLTPDELHELGLREVARVQAEMREAFTGMGYPDRAELSQLVGRAVDEAGFMPMESQADRDAVIKAWEALVDEAEQRTDAAFGLRPGAALQVIGGLGGEYYVPGPIDGAAPCEFHVGQSASDQPKYIMRNIASHEAIPGHHYQVGLAQELALPRFRTELKLQAFSEGWAVYAERLSYELGLYDDDPYGNIGRLLCELLRAARLVTDTGIHAMRWTRADARAYMDATVGATPGTFDREVDRFVVGPAMVTANQVGMLQIVGMRTRAQKTLGDDFDMKAFHDTVIGNGSMPLVVLSGLVYEYIETASRADG